MPSSRPHASHLYFSSPNCQTASVLYVFFSVPFLQKTTESITNRSTPFWPYRPTDTTRFLPPPPPPIDTPIQQEEATEEENFAPFPIKNREES